MLWLVLTLLQCAILLTKCQCPWDDAKLATWDPTWNTNGSQIIISRPTLLNSSPGRILMSITINNGGSLVISNNRIQLDVNWIFVKTNGSLIIGSPTCPIQSSLTITFFGEKNTESPMGLFGKKGLAMQKGGKVDIIGKTNGISWTFLNGTAKKGDFRVNLKDPVQWNIGDRIVIAGSAAHKLGLHEVRTITNITNNGRTLTLDQSLSQIHLGVFPETSEVGLLSRRIVLRGDSSSVVSEFGGHVLFNGPNVRVSGVQFTRMGQLGFRARYPLHFHLINSRDGRVDPPYNIKISSNSFHDNFQRCITIHETDNVTLTDNVCYNTNGHMYFLEDASERFNKFHYNLGILAKNINEKDRFLISDRAASIFWITNPQNDFIGNSAVDGDSGFWFSFPERVIGLAAKIYAEFNTSNPHPEIQPRYNIMGTFANNTAHSCHNSFLMAGFVKSNGNSTESLGGPSVYRPCYTPFPVVNNVPVVGSRHTVPVAWNMSRIVNTVAWRNTQSGMWIKGLVVIENSVIVDSKIGFFNSGKMVVRNSVVTTNSPYWTSRPSQGQTGFSIYDADAPIKIEDIVFIGFNASEGQATALTLGGAGPLIPETQVSGIHLVDSQVRLNNDDMFTYTHPILDIDGSLTGFLSGGWHVPGGSMTVPGCLERNKRDNGSPQTMHFCPFDGRLPFSFRSQAPVSDNKYTFNSKTYDFAKTYTQFAIYVNYETGKETKLNIYGDSMSGTNVFSEGITYHYYAIDGFALPIASTWKLGVRSVMPGTSHLFVLPCPNSSLPLVVKLNKVITLTRTPDMNTLRTYPWRHYFHDAVNERLYLYLQANSSSTTNSTVRNTNRVFHEGYTTSAEFKFAEPTFQVEFLGCRGQKTSGIESSCPPPANVFELAELPSLARVTFLNLSSVLTPCGGTRNRTLPRFTLPPYMLPYILNATSTPYKPFIAGNQGNAFLTLLNNNTRRARISIIWPDPTRCNTSIASQPNSRPWRSIGTFLKPPHVLEFQMLEEEYQDWFVSRLPLRVRVLCETHETSWCDSQPATQPSTGTASRAQMNPEDNFPENSGSASPSPPNSSLIIGLVVGPVLGIVVLVVIVVVVVLKDNSRKEEDGDYVQF